MLVIEASRSASRAVVERFLKAFTQYDKVVFKDVDLGYTYEIVQEGRIYVLAINDPTIEVLYDCGD